MSLTLLKNKKKVVTGWSILVICTFASFGDFTKIRRLSQFIRIKTLNSDLIRAGKSFELRQAIDGRCWGCQFTEAN